MRAIFSVLLSRQTFRFCAAWAPDLAGPAIGSCWRKLEVHCHRDCADLKVILANHGRNGMTGRAL
jgi:hypothetical protein